MRILWLRVAEHDLDAIVDYLLERDPAVARHIYQIIREKVSMLADHPGMGRPGRVAETRELVITETRYIVAYTVDTRRDAVIILRVLHGAQRWPDQFLSS